MPRSSSRSSSSSKKRLGSKFAARFRQPKKAAAVFDNVVSGPYEKIAMQTAMRTVQHEFVGQPQQIGRDIEYDTKNLPGVKFVAHAVKPPANSPTGKFRGQRQGTRRVQHRPTSGNVASAYRGTRRSGVRINSRV